MLLAQSQGTGIAPPSDDTFFREFRETSSIALALLLTASATGIAHQIQIRRLPTSSWREALLCTASVAGAYLADQARLSGAPQALRIVADLWADLLFPMLMGAGLFACFGWKADCHPSE